MPWFKVDDGLAFHPKVIAVGNAAMGLWVRAGAYCASQLTDGRLPRAMLAPLGGRARDAERLVECGLWDATADGWSFRSWADFQPTKAQVEAERRATAERVAAWRERRRNDVTNSTGNAVSNDSSSGAGTPAPTRPDPTRPYKETRAHKVTNPAIDAPADAGAKTAKTSRGARIPEPFPVTPEMVEWARTECPGLDHRAVTARFVDYWRAIPGAKGVKLDWAATWRNWMRREATDRTQPQRIEGRGTGFWKDAR